MCALMQTGPKPETTRSFAMAAVMSHERAAALLGRCRKAVAAVRSHRLFLPCTFYFFVAIGHVSLLPYLNVFFQHVGMRDSTIGMLSAARPWVNTVAGIVVPGVADKYRCHKALMMGCLVSLVLVRASFWLAAAAPVLLGVLVLVSEALAAPAGVFVDSYVTMASKDVSLKHRLQRVLVWV